ncbi:MAG: CAP domain-containing protein [Gaiellaceae bacterium]
MKRLLLVAALLAGLLPAAASAGIQAADELEAPVLRELNRVRAEHRLPLLRASRPLARAADFHGVSMARRGYFTHDSFDGTSFDRRVARFYPVGSSAYWAVGENLLWSASTITPRRVVELWMASPGHRRNILSPRYRELGVTAVRASAAPGVFGGREVTILVTDFGTRR